MSWNKKYTEQANAYNRAWRAANKEKVRQYNQHRPGKKLDANNYAQAHEAHERKVWSREEGRFIAPPKRGPLVEIAPGWKVPLEDYLEGLF